MIHKTIALVMGLSVGLLVMARPVVAQIFASGSTGEDGQFNPTSNPTTRALPASGVFNFTTVNIPAGVTVRFTKNATNTPVTILASGDVTIAGTIDVSGSAGTGFTTTTNLARTAGNGGPGGFDGGNAANGLASTAGGAGLGPGGGSPGSGNGNSGGGSGHLNIGGNAGGAGGPAYGSPALLPLIGGSGGGGGGAGFGATGGGGGGGAGAIVIASSGTITLTGSILATGGAGGAGATSWPPGPGGGGGGAGGAVRLVATTVAGSGGTINVNGGVSTGSTGGGTGSPGRVRIEAFTNTASMTFPNAPSNEVTSVLPTSVTLSSTPALAITTVAGVAAPASPLGSLTSPDITLPAGTTNPVAVSVAAANIPAGTVVTVTAKGLGGAATSATGTLTGTNASSTASISVTIPATQPCVITVTASFTLLASTGGGPVYADGEEVERVRVSSTLGGVAQVAYLTRSGREIVLPVAR